MTDLRNSGRQYLLTAGSGSVYEGEEDDGIYKVHLLRHVMYTMYTMYDLVNLTADWRIRTHQSQVNLANRDMTLCRVWWRGTFR